MVGKLWELGENDTEQQLVFNADIINNEIFGSYKNNGHARGAQVKGILDNKYGSSAIKHTLERCDDCASVVKWPAAKSSKYTALYSSHQNEGSDVEIQVLYNLIDYLLYYSYIIIFTLLLSLTFYPYQSIYY